MSEKNQKRRLNVQDWDKELIKLNDNEGEPVDKWFVVTWSCWVRNKKVSEPEFLKKEKYCGREEFVGWNQAVDHAVKTWILIYNSIERISVYYGQHQYWEYPIQKYKSLKFEEKNRKVYIQIDLVDKKNRK